jgi:hypothetical protein
LIWLTSGGRILDTSRQWPIGGTNSIVAICSICRVGGVNGTGGTY